MNIETDRRLPPLSCEFIFTNSRAHITVSRMIYFGVKPASRHPPQSPLLLKFIIFSVKTASYL